MNVATSAVLAHSWLLLIHQIPAKPAYLRVKIWRRLQGIGAIAVKNAVHVLPMNEETQGDFEWLLREIEESGGEAWGCFRECRQLCADDWSRERKQSSAIEEDVTCVLFKCLPFVPWPQ